MRAPQDIARRLAPVLKALSDENRLAILLAISQRSQTVVELMAATELSQPLVSHHLKTLRENGLVAMTPQGRSNVYSICCEAIAVPIEMLTALAAPAPSHSTAGA